MTTPPKPDHEKRPFRFKLEGPFLRVSTMLLMTPISPNFKGLKCSVFGCFRALQSRKNYGIIISSAINIPEQSYDAQYKAGGEVRCETMSNVIVKENETLDSALRRFKRNCAKAGIQQEIRKREHYEKPSVRRKKKSEAARKRKFN